MIVLRLQICRLSKKLGVLNEDGVYFLLVDLIAIGIENSRPVLIYDRGRSTA
jgi:hypothetical protein